MRDNYDNRAGRREARRYTRRNEVDQEAQFEDPHEQFNTAGHECEEEHQLDGFTVNVGEGEQSHQAGGSDGDLFHCAEENVSKRADKSGVQSVLGVETGESGVSD